MPKSNHNAQSMIGAINVAEAMNAKIEGILPYKKSSLSSPSATAATYGTPVDLNILTDGVGIFPKAIDIVIGGTVGSETITSTVTVTYTDATTATIDKTATATGTTSLTATEIMGLLKDGVFIKKINVKSKTTATATDATVTFNHCGLLL